MTRTVASLFDSFAHAQSTVQDLVDNGFAPDHISLISNDAGTKHIRRGADQLPKELGTVGALGGSISGGILGILVGIGTLSIPGIGTVLAAGPFLSVLASTAIGATLGGVTGGLIGALVGAGIPQEDANYYAEGVRRGGTLVLVETTEDRVTHAVDIMRRHNPVDLKTRAEEWRAQGDKVRG